MKKWKSKKMQSIILFDFSNGGDDSGRYISVLVGFSDFFNLLHRFGDLFGHCLLDHRVIFLADLHRHFLNDLCSDDLLSRFRGFHHDLLGTLTRFVRNNSLFGTGLLRGGGGSLLLLFNIPLG